MTAQAIYRAFLLCYPAAFRREYGREMQLAFADQLDEARHQGSVLAVWLGAAADVFTVAPKEHWHVILQDVKYALRTMASSPAFTAVAIFSLALGIGPNTAIFSLWNGVLHSSLPVPQPEQLVMLTDPNSVGVSQGSQDGARSLLTYAEFEQLRDHADGFSGMMASQSSLDRWQVRVQNSEWEEAHGRLVSGSYFQVLGVTPIMGRAFNESDLPYAVISYDYWQRRFGGSPDVLGKTVTVRKAALTILGVAPQGFIGETSGQQPDLWVPLRMQPGVLPGRDWLHDKGADKVMWLHVFARLRPGVSIAQAQASANAVFHSGLEAYYGAILSPEAQRQLLDQRLVVRPASAGASNVRQQLADPLKILLAAVGVVLLIACGNLANLLLARGTARQREVALRLSLGASRARLIRQLLTESLVLASIGGVAGLAGAFVLHRLLVRMISQGESDFQMAFRLEPRVLAFCLGATFLASLLFGLLPAWLTTKTDVSAGLKSQGRSMTGSTGQLRWGRLLVAAQLALSLPLLVGSGLLLRTLHNLQNANLGYSADRLLVVRVDAQTAGYEAQRVPPLIRQLLDQIVRVPGVRAASYSDNGLFSGRDSADEIEVEGYVRTGDKDKGSRWDQIGPGYFTTLGVPMLMGRDINEGDQPSSTKVCVINEAFARKFFAGRNPIGMRITNVYADNRVVYYIVGVAKDSRSHSLRRDVDPRYYVAATQPLSELDGAVFIVRTSTDTGPVLKGIQQVIRSIDPTIPILHATTVEDRLKLRLAQDRIITQLAAAFGLVALLLSAVGLYGVLAYGVVRRRSEIGIRIAMGAQPRRVVKMILGETWTMVIAGLVFGGALAYGASRLIASQLYGLAPYDPATLTTAVAVLALVALLAAYLPARRASRLDPMVALRQE